MDKNKPVKESIIEYAQGTVGGLLFSFPLLYTMEVWYSGFLIQPSNLILMVIFTFLLLLGYNRYAGMHPGTSWKNVVIDSVEEMGIGLILSFCLLLMLNRIQLFSDSLDEIMGKVIIEAMIVSIGVSIGTAQLGTNANENGDSLKEQEKEPSEAEKIGLERRLSWKALVVLAFCGSILVGGSVAPTEEVLLIAVESTPLHLLLMAIISLLISMVVSFFIEFRGTDKSKPKASIYDVIFGTSLSYSVAIIASAFVLWYFGGFSNHSYWNIIAQCIVLGVISSLGASAGRLLIT